jgi:hypothetical protein
MKKRKITAREKIEQEIDELEGDIDDINEEIEELKRKLEAIPETWKPKAGQIVWYVTEAGMASSLIWKHSAKVKALWKVGNIFKCELDAKRSLYYVALNSKYHYYIANMNMHESIIPVKIDIEYSNNCDEPWRKNDEGLGLYDYCYDHRWLKVAGEEEGEV